MGGARGAMASPDFGRSVNPISTRVGIICPPNSNATPGFLNLTSSYGHGQIGMQGSLFAQSVVNLGTFSPLSDSLTTT
jgi:hypothetical protein